MANKVFENLRGSFVLILLCFFTLLAAIPILVFGLLKLIPCVPMQNICRNILERAAIGWMYINVYGAKLLLPTVFKIQGLKALKKKGSYTIIANHQSWMDITVLENIFIGKIPFGKFFIKNEFKWVPIIGLSAWAMDFPFMKRYSKAYLEKHPEKKGKDLDETKAACEKFKHLPLTLVNFSEGTRFSAVKAKKQESPYQYLLKPRAGGISLIMSILGEKMDAILGVTIFYPGKAISLWEYLCGRMKEIKVDVRAIPVTPEMVGSLDDEDYVNFMRGQVNEIWAHKDIVMKTYNN